MADKQTMKDHIDDLMTEVADVRARLRNAETDAQLHRSMLDLVRQERDELSLEVLRLRALADQLVEAADIQMSMSTVPVSFTKVIHTQHWKDALAAYQDVVGSG